MFPALRLHDESQKSKKNACELKLKKIKGGKRMSELLTPRLFGAGK